MVENKWAIIGILAGVVGGYAFAYNQVKDVTCLGSFPTDVTSLRTTCPASLIDIMKYYNKLGTVVPK